eukprot:GDKI01015823.1.p1 GENE.GDKI01015823.1~~GDKI01015823.1.p1  ORF type:complete len:153 (-),score=25.92 GDKI01015823.1:46-504(-)
MFGSWWSVFANVITPVGLILLLGLLSGVKFIERTCRSICRMKFIISERNLITIRLVTLMAAIAGLALIAESISLNRLGEQKESVTTGHSTPQAEDRWRMKLWLHQRNWWISLLNFGMWLVVSRVSGLVFAYRERLEKAREENKKLEAMAKAR